ncbi:hypothetical protein Trydic_g9485 [Trypoxylus dichotomus]
MNESVREWGPVAHLDLRLLTVRPPQLCRRSVRVPPRYLRTLKRPGFQSASALRVSVLIHRPWIAESRWFENVQELRTGNVPISKFGNIMMSKGSQVVDQPSWSSQSASPSPPPPPLPPPVVARWARTEQSSAESCPHCRGRLASLPTRTTSLSSYSACKGKEN